MNLDTAFQATLISLPRKMAILGFGSSVGPELAILILLAFPLGFGWFGSWVAGQKKRRKREGFILGLLFGPLGVLVEVLLPAAEDGGHT